MSGIIGAGCHNKHFKLSMQAMVALILKVFNKSWDLVGVNYEDEDAMISI